MNLYGQYRYGRDKRYTDYEKLRNALDEMMNGLAKLESTGFEVKVGVPYKLGCKNAGGSWDIVLGILKEVSGMYKRDIWVYKLETE